MKVTIYHNKKRIDININFNELLKKLKKAEIRITLEDNTSIVTRNLKLNINKYTNIKYITIVTLKRYKNEKIYKIWNNKKNKLVAKTNDSKEALKIALQEPKEDYDFIVIERHGEEICLYNMYGDLINIV